MENVNMNDDFMKLMKNQQDMIQNQQAQINALLEMQQSHKIVDEQRDYLEDLNPEFEKEVQYTQKNDKPNLKIDPYKILGMTKNYDKNSLKKSYLKMAVKYHPDKRGGDPKKFKIVTLAYKILLKKLDERDNDKIHNDLKSGSEDYIKEQTSNNRRNVNMRDRDFDINKFNKEYSENRLKDDFADDGYGDWLKQQEEEETGVKMDQFNKNKFHNEFLKQKKKKTGSNLQKYADPEELVSMGNRDSIMILGKEKVSSYSGESNGLAYRDLREAYTESTLIDTGSVDLSKRKNNIKDYNSQRKNVNHQMSESDIRAQVMREEQEKKDEVARLSRVTNRDKEIGTHYEMMHQRLMGN
jgi:curved DNA-binding protein CbpA|tara:strand:+ start:68 stop:1129 length:1062 start_codon:yes stop_codon:yes gene_type:complete